MSISGISDEQVKEKLQEFSAEDLVKLAREEGVELTDASSVKQTCPLARL